MRLLLSLILFGIVSALAPACAADIPLDDAGFTAYIQQKLQLYSPAPVRITAPFSVAIGADRGANLVYSFKPLHDDCVRAPAQCPARTHDYVQDIVRRFPSANAGPSPSQSLPGDKAAFMAWVAAELERLLPSAAARVDGMTVNVIRAGGVTAIPFDQSDYYQRCAAAHFQCHDGMEASLRRIAAWLAPPERTGLRASLRFMAGCPASGASGVTCVVRPSRDPMAPIFRRGFANLQEVCFKTLGDSYLAVTNADREILDRNIDNALALCEQVTHAALGLLVLPPPGADGIGVLSGPFAASHALFPADWGDAVRRAGGHLIIALPAHDQLLFMFGDSAAQIAALGARVRSAPAESSTQISGDVYRWNGDGWSLATDSSVTVQP